MKLYRSLSGPDDASFYHKVTAALNNGWQLHGDPVHAFDAAADAMRCAQAVVKDVDRQTYTPKPSSKIGRPESRAEISSIRKLSRFLIL